MLNFTLKNSMNSILIHTHSGLRWVALVLIVGAIINSMLSKSRNTYEKKDKLLNLFAMISLHLQLTIGLILYFVSDKVQFSAGWMKNTLLRFYGMEHVLLMLLAIIIVTIGRRKCF
jgi:ABC-type xylose transport system permease subunit